MLKKNMKKEKNRIMKNIFESTRQLYKTLFREGLITAAPKNKNNTIIAADSIQT